MSEARTTPQLASASQQSGASNGGPRKGAGNPPKSNLGPLGWLTAAQTATRIAGKSQAALRAVLERNLEQGDPAGGDPLNLREPFLRVAEHLARHPGYVAKAELDLWWQHMKLAGRQVKRVVGAEVEPVAAPERTDRRFKHPKWTESLLFDTLKQSYLLTSSWLRQTLSGVEGLDEETQKRVDFHVRQFTSALSPTNFAATNPEVLEKTLETGGRNLLAGLENLLDDIQRGRGQLKVRITDEEAFVVGKDVATTPGKVVFQTPLMQLLHFVPTTAQVRRTPLIIVPPWINKYYILDLRPENSLVRWALDQGHSVFVISWVNPDRELSRKSFEDYLREGTLAALDAVRVATGEPQANVMAYCLGGTLVACTLGYLAARGEQDRVASATFMASITDFSQAGDIRVFIDEKQVKAIEDRMERQGYLDAPAMAFSFNALRENDLVWTHVVNNYLLGQSPMPFDLLFWNADATRMPAAMHSFYLRNMYLENNLMKAGAIKLLGEAIDLRQVTVPAYWVSLSDDHIAPWKATYAGTQLLAGPKRFVLGGSGHIAGVINPPAKAKYGYFTHDALPASPDEWLEGAAQQRGSWWTDWQQWVEIYAGPVDSPARAPGEGPLSVLEDAPGSFVLYKA